MASVGDKRLRKDDDRSDEPGGADNTPSSAISKEDLEEFRNSLMADVNASIQKSVAEFGQSFGTRTFAATADLVKKMDLKHEKRFSALEKDIDKTQKRQASLESSQAEQYKIIQELQKAFAVAEA